MMFILMSVTRLKTLFYLFQLPRQVPKESELQVDDKCAKQIISKVHDFFWISQVTEQQMLVKNTQWLLDSYIISGNQRKT